MTLSHSFISPLCHLSHVHPGACVVDGVDMARRAVALTENLDDLPDHTVSSSSSSSSSSNVYSKYTGMSSRRSSVFC